MKLKANAASELLHTVEHENSLSQPATGLSQASWRDGDFEGGILDLRTATATAVGDGNGIEGWPGIVSRFQLVLLAGRRSKQLFQGAQPRIPADPLKRRNTSIALEELRLGLVPFRGQNGTKSQTILTSIDTLENTTVATHAPDFDLPKTE